jgi:hypothetical protein
MGTVDVTIAGVLTLVYAFGEDSKDQKSSVALKVTGKKGSWATLGANELKETPQFLVPSRRQWREIPGKSKTIMRIVIFTVHGFPDWS